MLLRVDNLQGDVRLVTEVAAPGPAARHYQPVVRDHQAGERTGPDGEFVNPAELSLHVPPHLSPVSPVGVPGQAGDEGVAGPVIQGPEPGQGQAEQGQQHRRRQQVEEEWALLQVGGQGGETSVHGGEIAEPQQVAEWQD